LANHARREENEYYGVEEGKSKCVSSLHHYRGGGRSARKYWGERQPVEEALVHEEKGLRAGQGQTEKWLEALGGVWTRKNKDIGKAVKKKTIQQHKPPLFKTTS